MGDDLVQTPNGTFVTREVAEAHGLEVPKAVHKTTTRKATAKKTTAKKTTARKRVASRKGK